MYLCLSQDRIIQFQVNQTIIDLFYLLNNLIFFRQQHLQKSTIEQLLMTVHAGQL